MSAVDPNANNNAALIEAIERLGEVEISELTGPYGKTVDVLVLPHGKTALSIKPFLDEYLVAPERKKGMSVLTRLESFVAHVNRFKDPESAVFASDNMNAATLTAVLDYHETGAGSPRFGQHRAHYAFPMSDEWAAWKAAHDKPKAQKDFAAFLEDRILDVIDPGQVTNWKAFEALSIVLANPGELLTLSRGLTVNVNSRVANHANLSSGEARMTFETKHTDATGGELRIPGGFALAIPVFRGGAPYQIPVRLRYEIDKESGSVMWRVLLYRTDLIFRHAFDEAVELVKVQTSLPVFIGAPEGGA